MPPATFPSREAVLVRVVSVEYLLGRVRRFSLGAVNKFVDRQVDTSQFGCELKSESLYES